MKNFLYHVRYASYLYLNVPWMSILHAWRYPLPNPEDRHEPEDDAAEEIHNMADGDES